MGSNWLFSKSKDLILLFLPVWVCWLICFIIPTKYHETEVSILFWFLIVLCIDVSHVWSTIFRTYLDKEEWKIRPQLLIVLPIGCFILLFSISYFSIGIFWRFMAYLALYHFIKQQFGFMMYYVAKRKVKLKKILKDKWVIYLGMLYPVIYWHITGDRNFEWFTEGDFILLENMNFSTIRIVTETIYWTILILWIIEDYWVSKKQNKSISIGKNFWMVTTWFNWYLGIVYFNSDFAFTLTNVVAHGIPYIVLLSSYIIDKQNIKNDNINNTLNKKLSLITFILIVIFILSYIEEYFWDTLINHEKGSVFLSQYTSQPINDSFWLAIILALLSLPQVIHYVLDAFIWKVNASNPYIKKTILK